MKTLKLKKLFIAVSVILLAIALIIAGQNRQEQIVKIAKQRYLDNNSSSRVLWGDLTGNGYDASGYNATWNDSSTGMLFNGTSSYAQIKEVNLAQFTLEVGFRATNLEREGEQTLMANFEQGGYGLLIQNKRLIGKAFLDGEWKTISTEYGEGIISDILEENVLYLAHLTFDGTKLSLYLDGELVGTVEGTTLTYPENNTVMMLGADPNGTNVVEEKYFEGTINVAKIYTKGLSEDEIETNLTIIERVYADGVSGRLNNIEGYVQDGLLMDLEGRKIERTLERVADLSLRTFITKINGEEISATREPVAEKENDAFVYKHSKNKVNVVKGDVVTYTIRVYNEGREAANAEKVGIYLPEEMSVVGLSEADSVNKTYMWMQDEGNVFITKYLSNQEVKKNGVTVIENRSIPGYAEATGLQYRDVELELIVTEDLTIDEGARLVVVAEIMKESQNDSDSTPRNFNMTPADIKTYKKQEAESSTSSSYIAGKEDDDDFENVYVNKTYDAKIELNKISIANEKNIGGGKIRVQNNVADSDIRIKTYHKATLAEMPKDSEGYIIPPQEGVLIGLSRLQKNVENEILIEEESAPERYKKVIDSVTLQVKINDDEEIEAKIINVVEKKIKADGTVETQVLDGSIEKDAFLRDEDSNGLVTKDGITTGQRVEYKVGEDGEWTRYTGPFKLQTNKTIYARSTDGTNYSGTTIKVVDNIDKIAPVIDTIADKEETLDIETSIDFHVTDTGSEDYGASGISKFGISENDVDEPEEWFDADKTTDYAGTVENIGDEGTFRLWVKDVAGNIAISNEFRIDLPNITVVRITAIVDANGNEISNLINTEYYTLEDCLNAIPEGATANVQVIHRIYNEANVIDGNKNITLDLNGYTVGNRSRTKPTLTVGSDESDGRLTIINNKGRGGLSSNHTEGVVVTEGSSFTLGEDNRRVLQTQPKIVAKTTGVDVRNGGEFNLYDGTIIGERAIYGNVESTPIGYNAFIEDSPADDTQTATLQIISNVEARIGRKMYTLLEEAIADCQTKYGTDGSQVTVVLLKDIAKDQTITIAENQNIKLDLNGHDFTTVTSGYVVDNKGQFELFDSSVMTGSYDYKVEAEDGSKVTRTGGDTVTVNGFTGVQKYNELAFNFEVDEFGTYMLSTSGIYMSREADMYLDDSDASLYNFAEKAFGSEYTTVNVILDNLEPGTHRIRIVNTASNEEVPIIDYFEVSNNKGAGRIYSTTNHVIHNWNFDERVTDISKIDTVDYEELISSENVSLHNGFKFGFPDDTYQDIYRDIDNSIAINETTSEAWRMGYVEVDLTDKEVKPYLLQINYHAKSTGNRNLKLYFQAFNKMDSGSNQNAIFNKNGGNFNETATYKAYVSGGAKYAIHMALYKNYSCNNEFDFRINSIRLIDVDNFNMAQMTITSGIIDSRKPGVKGESTGGIFNEGNLTVKGGRFTGNIQTGANNYRAGISNKGFVTIQDGQFDGEIYGIENGYASLNKYDTMPAMIKINNVDMLCNYTNMYIKGQSTIEIRKGNYRSVKNYSLALDYENSIAIINPEADEDVNFQGSGASGELIMLADENDAGRQLYIKGGTFKSLNSRATVYSTNYWWLSSKEWPVSQITIDGGYFESAANNLLYLDDTIATINGGTFNANGLNVAQINTSAELEINGGEFTGKQILYMTQGSWENSQNITINGGRFTNVDLDTTYPLFSSEKRYNVYFTVNGGEFIAKNQVFNESYGKLHIRITGGDITSLGGTLVNSTTNEPDNSVTIGTKDGNVEMQPEIKCSPNHPLIVNPNVTFKFYDGVLYAKKDPFMNCIVTEIEENVEMLSENYGETGLKVWLGNDTSVERVEIYECQDNPSLVGTRYSSIQKALDVCNLNAGDNVTKIRLLDDYSNFNSNVIKKGQNVVIDQDSYNLNNYANDGFINHGDVKFINTQDPDNYFVKELKNNDLLTGNNVISGYYNFSSYRVVKDKSDRHNDLELMGVIKDAESNGIKFNGVNHQYGMFRNYNITKAEQKSFEIVLKTTTQSNNIMFISPAGRNFCFGIYRNYFILTTSERSITYTVPADYYDGTMKDIIVNYDEETNKYTIYYNGEKLTNTSSSDRYNEMHPTAAILGGESDGNYMFTGTIFAVRQYSEQLTEEQIIANYSVNQAKYVNNENVDNYTKQNIILDIDSSQINWDEVLFANTHPTLQSRRRTQAYQVLDLRDEIGEVTITVNAETKISNSNSNLSMAHARILTENKDYSPTDTIGRFIYLTTDTTATDYTYVVDGGRMYYLYYGIEHGYHNTGVDSFIINSIKMETTHRGKIQSKNSTLLRNGRCVEEGAWQDLSGSNRHGILVGPTWDEDDRGLIFDGNNDYVRIAQMNYQKFAFETTFEFSSINSGWNTIFSNYNSGGFALTVNGSTKKLYARACINGNYRDAVLDIPIEVNTKYTAGVMYDEDGLHLYVNGILINSWKSSDYDTFRYPDNSTYVNLGGDSYASEVRGEWFSGKIYSFRGYNRGLTALEIAQNYQKDRELYYGNDTEYIENIEGHVRNGLVVDYEGRHHEDSKDNSMHAKLEGLYIKEQGQSSRDIIKNAGTLDVDIYRFNVSGSNVTSFRNYNDAIINIHNMDYDSTATASNVFSNNHRSTVNVHNGDVELTCGNGDALVFNNRGNSVANIYNGVVKKNGCSSLNDNYEDATMNIYDGTILFNRTTYQSSPSVITNRGNAKLNIHGGVINSINIGDQYYTKYVIYNYNNAEFHITGGKIYLESQYNGTSYAIHNSSTKECSIENYDIKGKEIGSYTVLNLLYNDTMGKITIKNSKFWQNEYSSSFSSTPSAIDNRGTIEADNLTIESTRYGIRNIGGTMTLKDTSSTGNVLGIYQQGGTTQLYGDSNIVAQNGVQNASGTFTLGQEGANEDESATAPIVNINKPRIIGDNYGIDTVGTFNFYDGRITSKNDKSIVGSIANKESGYQLKIDKYTEDSIAKEDSYLAQLPIIEIVGVGQYTNLPDFQTALDGLNTNREYQINLLEPASIDETDASINFKENLKAVFDIKGHKILSANTNVFTNEGDITFVDSVGTGELSNNSSGSFFVNNGKMKLTNVKVVTLGAGPAINNWKKIFDNNGELEFSEIEFVDTSSANSYMIENNGTGTFKDTNSTIKGLSAAEASSAIANNSVGNMEFNGTRIETIGCLVNRSTGEVIYNDVYQVSGYEIRNYDAGNITFNGTSKIYTTYGVVNKGSLATGTITVNDQSLISGSRNGLTNESTGTIIINDGTVEATHSTYTDYPLYQTGNGLIKMNGGTISRGDYNYIYAGKFIVDGDDATINGGAVRVGSTSGRYGTFELVRGNVNTYVAANANHTTINILGGNLTSSAASYAIDGARYLTTINIGTKDGNVTNSPHITGYIWAGAQPIVNYYDGTITVANVSSWMNPEYGIYGLINEYEEGYMPVKTVNAENADWYDINLELQKEIAEVDGVKYDDLQDAIDACTTSGKTIKLLKDYMPVKKHTIPSGIDGEYTGEEELKKITFDLNGHILVPIGRNAEDTTNTILSRTLFINNADFTIIDSVEADEDQNGERLTKNKKGKIHGFAQSYVENYGKLEISGVNLIYKFSEHSETIKNQGRGDVVLDNLYILDHAGSNYSPDHRVINNYSTGTISIKDSTIDMYGYSGYYIGTSEQWFVKNNVNNAEKKPKLNISNITIVARNTTGSGYYYLVGDDGQMDVQIEDSTISNFQLYGSNAESEVVIKGTEFRGVISGRNSWFTIEDSTFLRRWNYSYSETGFNGGIRSIKNSNFPIYVDVTIVKTDGAGIVENSSFNLLTTRNGANLEFYNVTITDYVHNGYEGQNCILTIHSGNYKKVINAVNSHLYIYGGTFNNTSGEAINNAGSLTLGSNDGDVSIDEPPVTGSTYGIVNTGTFNFFDGIIQGGTSAINGSVTTKPDSYRVNYQQGNTIAVLEYVTQVENAVSMNGVYYNTLDAAIKVAPAGVETTLYINNEIGLTDTFVIPNDKNIVINLQGNSITYSSTEATILNHGTLKIYDEFYNSEGALETTFGAVRNDRGVAIDNRGTLILGVDDGTIDTSTPSIIALGEPGAGEEAIDKVVKNLGTFKFYDGMCVLYDNYGNTTEIPADGSIRTANIQELSTLRKLADNIQGNNQGMITSILSNPEISATPSYWTNQDVDVTMNATDRVIMNIGDRQQGMDLSLKQYVSKVGERELDREPVITEETEQAILRTQNGVYGRATDEVYADVDGLEDEITYTINIYNEGTETGYAAEIIEFIPAGMTFDATNSVNIANGWEVASTDQETGRITAVKTNNLENIAALADLNGDTIIKILTGEIDTVPSVDLVLKVTEAPKKEKVYYTVNGEITAAKDSSGNTYGEYFTTGNGVNSDLDSTPGNYPEKSEDDNDGDTFYTIKKKTKIDIMYLDVKTMEAIADPTTIEGFVGDPYNVLAYGKIIQNYTLVQEPDSPAGTFADEGEIKVFYYAHNASVTVNHIDKHTNKVIETETITGLEDQDYTTSSKTFTGYDLITTQLPSDDIASGKMTKTPIVVNYYYERKTTVRVKYLDKYLTGDSAKLREDIIIEGHENDAYTTEEKTFTGYKLDEATRPQNATGTMAVTEGADGEVNTETVVIYYYVKESEGVEVLHKDTYSGKEIVDKEIKTGYEGESYTTQPKTFTLYDLDETRLPTNAEGTFTKEKKTVTYYYKHIANIRVEYVDKNTNQKIIDDEVIDGHENDVKEVRPKDITNYVLDPASQKDNYNVTMLVTRNAENEVTSFVTVVTFYYNKISAGVIEKHLDIYNNEVLEQKLHTGTEGQYYKINSKTFEGYDLVETRLPENAEGYMTVDAIEVVYYYARKTQLIVKFVDAKTNQEIPNTRITTNNHRGDSYTTTAKTIAGYKLQEDRLPTNASGTMEVSQAGDTTTIVTYYYAKQATVRIEYYDTKTNDKISTDTVLNGVEDAEYTASPKTITGFELDQTKLPTNATGVYTVERNANLEPTNTEIVVKYYYNGIAEKVEVLHKDTYTDKEIADKEIKTGYVGDPYTTQAKTFTLYDLDESKLPTNKDGVFTRETQTVTYYYKHVANIRVEYVDKNTNQKIIDDEIIDGHENDVKEVRPKDIANYILDPASVKNDYNVTMVVTRNAENEVTSFVTVVTFYYNKISAGVIEKHVDAYDNSLLENQITHPGVEGQHYKIDPKTFTGYDLDGAQLPSNAEGHMTVDAIEVVYYYARKTQLIVKFVDIQTNEEIPNTRETTNNHRGDSYTTTGKAITGYKLQEDRLPANATGTMQVSTNGDTTTTVIYYYEATSSAGVTVHYRDIKTNKDITIDGVSTTRVLTGERYANYETTPITIEGYTLVSTVEEEVEIDGQIVIRTVSKLPANANGQFLEAMQDVIYYYVKQATVKVEYYDILTNTKISEDTVLNGVEGENYSTSPKAIGGYVVDEENLPTNANGVYTVERNDNFEPTNTEIIVKYYYKAEAESVVVHHIDDKHDTILETETLIGIEGENYETNSKTFEGFDLVESKLPSNANGKFSKDVITVNYYYVRKTKVIVSYIDIEGGKLADDLIIDNHEGDEYTTDAKMFTNYRLIATPQNFKGTTKIKINDDDTVDVITYVTYEYESTLSDGLIVHHKDYKTKEELDTDTYTGARYTVIRISPKDIPMYNLAKSEIVDGQEVSLLPAKEEITLGKDLQEATYYYKKQAKVIVEYRESLTNEEIADSDVINGNEDDRYEVKPKDIKGYTPDNKKMPTNSKGVMTVVGDDNTITVVFYYMLIPEDVIEKYVDINTNLLVKEFVHKGEYGADYIITPRTIPGFTLIETDKDGNDIAQVAKGKYTTTKVEVVYYVALNTNVRVQHINLITEEKLSEDLVIKGYEGKAYETMPETFEGYELTNNPEESKGTMTAEEIVVKYYYAKKLDGLLPQTNEENTKQTVLMAIPIVILVNLCLAIKAFKRTKKEDLNNGEN